MLDTEKPPCLWRLESVKSKNLKLGSLKDSHVSKPGKNNPKKIIFELLPPNPPRLPHVNMGPGRVMCEAGHVTERLILCSSPETQRKHCKTSMLGCRGAHSSPASTDLHFATCLRLWFGFVHQCQHIEILIIAVGWSFAPNQTTNYRYASPDLFVLQVNLFLNSN